MFLFYNLFCVCYAMLSCSVMSNSVDTCGTRVPPGSPVPGILQARTLEWRALSFSNA